MFVCVCYSHTTNSWHAVTQCITRRFFHRLSRRTSYVTGIEEHARDVTSGSGKLGTILRVPQGAAKGIDRLGTASAILLLCGHEGRFLGVVGRVPYIAPEWECEERSGAGLSSDRWSGFTTLEDRMCVMVWKETALSVFFKENSAQQSASAEAYLHAATQQNLRILWNLIVHHRAHNSQLLGHSFSKFIFGIKSIRRSNLRRLYIL